MSKIKKNQGNLGTDMDAKISKKHKKFGPFGLKIFSRIGFCQIFIFFEITFEGLSIGTKTYVLYAVSLSQKVTLKQFSLKQELTGIFSTNVFIIRN